jgi:hypothetical protein
MAAGRTTSDAALVTQAAMSLADHTSDKVFPKQWITAAMVPEHFRAVNYFPPALRPCDVH